MKQMKKNTIIVLLILMLFLMTGCTEKNDVEDEKLVMEDLSSYTTEDIVLFADKVNLSVTIVEEYSYSKEAGTYISQSIDAGTEINEGDSLEVVFSKGLIDIDAFKDAGVNEMGNVPVMMYHKVVDEREKVDSNGYSRYYEDLISDLEFYYENGYRMISLSDYVKGDFEVELGYTPIILTFDDGDVTNFDVDGYDDNNEMIINEKSAIAILESFRLKYPDYNVTATFFVNCRLFGQPSYNEDIIKWLVDNGYDIGNHSCTHTSMSTLEAEGIEEELGKVTKLVKEIVPTYQMNTLSLPFGHHSNERQFESKLRTGEYEDVNYYHDAILNVGWDASYSPFSVKLDTMGILRVRAYDNNGKDYDIQYVFNALEETRYISDGLSGVITYPNSEKLDALLDENKIIDRLIIDY